MKLSGRVSWFGGPEDEGVAPDEGLAFIYEVDDAPHLFLDEQPAGTTGLARRLDPDVPYIACRWDYDTTPREMLLESFAVVRSRKTGRAFRAHPADWGPHSDTDRVADISPGLMEKLGISTDDEVDVIFPAAEFDHMLNKAVVDLSHWDDVESFHKAKRDGVIGIIHKVSEGASVTDDKYDENKKRALANRLLWGAYHFLRPGNMQQQARFFVDSIGEDVHRRGYLLAADHEDDGVSLDDLKDWLREVYALTGVRPILYSGHTLKEQLPDDERDDELAELTDGKLWLAQYTSGEPDWPKATFPRWFLWQYAENGVEVAGMPGDSEGYLDVNRYDGSPAQLREEWAERAPAPEPVPPEEEVIVTITVDAPPNVIVRVVRENGDNLVEG